MGGKGRGSTGGRGGGEGMGVMDWGSEGLVG
jgi:hypothetical protein